MRWALVVVVLLSSASRAAGDDAPFARAMAAYRRHQYRAAGALFAAAYAAERRPELLFAMAQAERLAGDCAQAMVHYDAYLQSRPSPARVASTRRAAARCTPLQRASLQRPVSTAPPAPPPLEPMLPDGIEPAPTLPAPVTPPPPARPSTALPTATPTPQSPAPPTLAALRAPPPPPPRPRPRARDWLGGLAAGSSAACLVAGAVTLALGDSAIDATRSAPSYAVFVARQGAVPTARAERTAGLALLGIGGALAVAATVRLALHARSRR